MMVIIYVDDILVVLKDISIAINYLAKKYVLKEGRMGPTKRYIFANTWKIQTVNGSVM